MQSSSILRAESREFSLNNRRKKWKGRALNATADEVFERALFGEDLAHSKSFDAREDRKMQQLYQQVRRSLSLALVGECDDDLLREVYVESVMPMGSGSQLLVRVVMLASLGVSSWEVLGRLNDRSIRLRAIVARAICRKRVPGLSFIVVPFSTEEGAI
jgi:ribosome-binding factor A